MVEYVYTKPKKSHRKEIALFIIIAVAVVVFLFQYEQIVSFLGVPDNQEECLRNLSDWCTECFITNNYHFDSWDVEGNNIGILAECSNTYLETDWTSNQDCTGNTLDYCISYIQE